MKNASRTLTLLAVAPLLAAQSLQPRSLSLADFVSEVLKTNMDAAAARYDVTSAEAQVSISRLLPDPELTTGVSSKEMYGPNKSESPTQYTAGLGWTLELGGKRSARVDVARCGVRKAQADLDAFLEDLRATAANAFIDSLKARKTAEQKRKVLNGFTEVLRMNEVRHAAGDIGGVELSQSRVEARRYEGELVQAEAEVRIADAALAQLLGRDACPVVPQGDLDFTPRQVKVDEVMAAALERRPEIQGARRNMELALSQVMLAKANRWVDLGLSVAVNHTPPVYATGLDLGGSPFPAPANMSNTLSATITIPIPFSRRQKGELIQVEAAKSQAKLQLGSMELKTRSDVESVVAQYEASKRQLQTFQDELLQDADKVFEGVRFSYQKGSASLMEVILAQRSSSEVHLACLEAQANHAKALVSLDRVTGGHAFLLQPASPR